MSARILSDEKDINSHETQPRGTARKNLRNLIKGDTLTLHYKIFFGGRLYHGLYVLRELGHGGNLQTDRQTDRQTLSDFFISGVCIVPGLLHTSQILKQHDMNKIFRARVCLRARVGVGRWPGYPERGVVPMGISNDSVASALHRRGIRKIYSIFRMVEGIREREVERERDEPSAGDAAPPGSPLERQ
jgi:hypothetical protein